MKILVLACHWGDHEWAVVSGQRKGADDGGLLAGGEHAPRLPLSSGYRQCRGIGGHLMEDAQMRGSRQHRRNAAADASLLLVQEALVQIRAMAYLRRDLGTSDNEGGAPGDYHERIRLIADVCENLPGHLRAGARTTPVAGLQYAWDNANETQRRWLRATLAQHHIVIGDIITDV
jgi:hypothetical protein